MSHFTVMVIGPDPEKQLAPYEENLAVPEYTDEEGEATTYNPQSKWDWYQLGGRWTGFLKLKPQAYGMTGSAGILTEPAKVGYADSARLGDIDVEGMRNEAEAKMRKRLVKIGTPRDWRSWEELAVEYPGVELRREVYWAQKDLIRVRGALGVFDDYDRYLATDEDLIAASRCNALRTFAIIKDGVWYERGKMGWGACVSEKKSTSDWGEEFEKLLDGLPPETLISIYDCHI